MDENPLGEQPIQNLTPVPEQPIVQTVQPTPPMVPEQPIPQSAQPIAPIQPQFVAQAPTNNPVAVPGLSPLVAPETNNIINNPINPVVNTSIVTNGKSKIKKIIIIALVVIALAVCGFFAYNYFFSGNNMETKRLEYIFDPKKPIKILKDEKYGFISSEGEMMVEPKYDDVSTNFVGDYALVMNRVDSSYSVYTSYLIDKNGKEVKNSDKDGIIRSLEFNEAWLIKNKLYDKNLKQISSDDIEVEKMYVSDYANFLTYESKDGKSAAVISPSGKIIYEYKIKDDEDFSIDDWILDEYDILDVYYGVVTVDDEQAIVNFSTGKVVYDFTKDIIKPSGSNIFFICDDEQSSYSKEEKCKESIYIENDKIVYKAESPEYIYQILYADTDNKVINITTPGSYSKDSKYFDVKTNKMLDSGPKYMGQGWSLTGYSTYECDDKYGLMKDDKVAVKCDYDDIEYLTRNTYKYVKLKTNKEIAILIEQTDDRKYNYTLFDLATKKAVKEFKKIDDLSYSGDSIFVDTYSYKKKVVYNMISDKSIEFDDADSIRSYSNYFIVVKDNKLIYYNTDFKNIYEI